MHLTTTEVEFLAHDLQLRLLIGLLHGRCRVSSAYIFWILWCMNRGV